MNLPETLVFSDINHLNRIANHYEINCNLSSKNELIQAILQNVLNYKQMMERMNNLSELGRRYLLILLLDQRNGFTYEDLVAKASQALKTFDDQTPSVSQRSLIHLLLNHGWIYSDSKKRGLIYYIPNDLRKRLLQGIKKQLAINTENFPDVQGCPFEILPDIYTFLTFISEEIIQLTVEGAIHKRQQQQLFKLFSVTENPLEGKSWRFGYGRRFHNYPDRFSLIYDFCFYQQYFKEEKHTLTLTSSGENLLQGQVELQNADVYRFWVQLYRKPIRNLQFLLSLLNLYIDEWISVPKLEKELITYLHPFYYDTPRDIFYKRILYPLIWLGVIEGDNMPEPQCIRRSQWANQLFTEK